MQAYAVLDGGGVKGAALAGCLLAAEEAQIRFFGYGGTSAGSIVALLACVGYSGTELDQIMTTQLNLGDLLSDIKEPLLQLQTLPEDLENISLWKIWKFNKYKTVLSDLRRNFGLVSGDKFVDAILELVRAKLGNDVQKEFNFSELKARGLPTLKIVASNLAKRQPVVFSASGGDEHDVPVLLALRASMSYPFIFKPQKLDAQLLVDGGLCSNLPAFLFDREREADRLPLLAFDLVTPARTAPDPYLLSSFVTDLLETALEAGDFLRRRSNRDFYHIEITVPDGIGTLDFDIPLSSLKALVNAGRAETASFINRELAQWVQARNDVERIQALYAPVREVEFVLEQFTLDLQRNTGMTNVRANVSIPTGRGARIVAYQYGMDNDPDQDLAIEEYAGCSGKCWKDREPSYADLEESGANTNYEQWGLTREQQAKVRKDRKAMLSVLIFDRLPLRERESNNVRLLGVLSCDTDKDLKSLGWSADEGSVSNSLEEAINTCKRWSSILTKVLR